MSTTFAPQKSVSKAAGEVVQQIIDPCLGPMVSMPDDYQGKVELVKSVTLQNTTADATGIRGIIVNAGSASKISFSGDSTYATWTHSDDEHDSDFDTNYKHMRCTGYCVKVQAIGGDDVNKGTLVSVCAPNVSYTARTASLVGIVDLPLQRHDMRTPFEMAWCPRSAKDFTPFVPSQTTYSGNDVSGAALLSVPALHLEIIGSTEGVDYFITVTARYEGFLKPASEYRGAQSAGQSSTAMDMIMNSLKSFSYVRVGNAIGRVAGNAAKVAGLIGLPAISSALMAGSTLIPKLAAALD